MQITNKVIQFMIAVDDMPKAKAFYEGQLGLKVVTDYRKDDKNWWVSFALPDGGTSIVLSTYHEQMKPGTITIYFATSDIAAAHKDLSDKGAKAAEIKDDLYGPGSGVKWFNMDDPDGNKIYLVQT